MCDGSLRRDGLAAAEEAGARRQASERAAAAAAAACSDSRAGCPSQPHAYPIVLTTWRASRERPPRTCDGQLATLVLSLCNRAVMLDSTRTVWTASRRVRRGELRARTRQRGGASAAGDQCCGCVSSSSFVVHSIPTLIRCSVRTWVQDPERRPVAT